MGLRVNDASTWATFIWRWRIYIYIHVRSARLSFFFLKGKKVGANLRAQLQNIIRFSLKSFFHVSQNTLPKKKKKICQNNFANLKGGSEL